MIIHKRREQYGADRIFWLPRERSSRTRIRRTIGCLCWSQRAFLLHHAFPGQRAQPAFDDIDIY